MKILSVGTPLRATRDIYNIFDGTTIPAGSAGIVVSVGPDAAYGWYNMRFIYRVNGIFAEHDFTGSITDNAEILERAS
jgi:hypothetical protein